MTRSEQLVVLRTDFEKRWGRPLDGWERQDFSMELDRLIYTAFHAAQEPFVRELEMFRDHATLLAPAPIVKIK